MVLQLIFPTKNHTNISSFLFFCLNFYESQDGRGRGKLFLLLLSTTSTHFTDTYAISRGLLQRAHKASDRGLEPETLNFWAQATRMEVSDFLCLMWRNNYKWFFSNLHKYANMVITKTIFYQIQTLTSEIHNGRETKKIWDPESFSSWNLEFCHFWDHLSKGIWVFFCYHE